MTLPSKDRLATLLRQAGKQASRQAGKQASRQAGKQARKVTDDGEGGLVLGVS
jgi:hypothetical protein